MQQRHGAVMTGAYGDTLFAQQVGEVGVVYTLDYKAGQGDVGRTKQAHALALLQAGQQLGMQGGLVGADGAGVKAIQVIQAGPEGNYRGNRRRAGLEAQWRGAKAGAGIVGVQQHLAAELPMRQLFQGLWAAIEQADAVRAIELVAGADIEVAAQSLHIME